MTLQVGDTYIDAGASARDNLDGDITARIVTINLVDTSRAGTYQVSYIVSDRAGNSASNARTVIVDPRVTRHGGGGSNDLWVLALLGVIGSVRRFGGQRDG